MVPMREGRTLIWLNQESGTNSQIPYLLSASTVDTGKSQLFVSIVFFFLLWLLVTMWPTLNKTELHQGHHLCHSFEVRTISNLWYNVCMIFWNENIYIYPAISQMRDHYFLFFILQQCCNQHPISMEVPILVY